MFTNEWTGSEPYKSRVSPPPAQPPFPSSRIDAEDRLTDHLAARGYCAGPTAVPLGGQQAIAVRVAHHPSVAATRASRSPRLPIRPLASGERGATYHLRSPTPTQACSPAPASDAIGHNPSASPGPPVTDGRSVSCACSS
jgi:hypothetical protein